MQNSEWPAHLEPIGSGDTKIPLGKLLRQRHHENEQRIIRRALAQRPETAWADIEAGRAMEAQLIAEAEREAAKR